MSVDWEKASGAVLNGLAAGAKAAASLILNAAKDNTPVQSGALRDSGTLTGEGLEIGIAFTAPYAAMVHESVACAHPGGGEAKFLEKAELESEALILPAVAECLRAALEEG